MLSVLERKALISMGDHGGFTAGQIAENCGCELDPKSRAVFRSKVVMPLFKSGFLRLMDRQKPMVFMLTDAGRKALAESK